MTDENVGSEESLVGGVDIEHRQPLLEPGAHVLAVCQPCVPTLAAVALMAEDQHVATPASMVLMAGPIDCRIARPYNRFRAAVPMGQLDSIL